MPRRACDVSGNAVQHCSRTTKRTSRIDWTEQVIDAISRVSNDGTIPRVSRVAAGVQIFPRGGSRLFVPLCTRVIGTAVSSVGC